MNIIKRLIGICKAMCGISDPTPRVIETSDYPFNNSCQHEEEDREPTIDLSNQREDDKMSDVIPKPKVFPVPDVIPMSSILSSKEFQDSQYKLPCAMGLTRKGEIFIFDLTREPNLLIAGGKIQEREVALDAIITSLINKKRPEELKLIMIDPTGDHFQPYQSLYGHFLATFEFMSSEQIEESTIIQKPHDIIDALKSLQMLMNKRYDLLKNAYTRNILEYNRLYNRGNLTSREGHNYMPYIVVVINELDEIVRNNSENVIPMLSNVMMLAKPTGIHFVVSIGHISEDSIPIELKMCIPARMAFKTSTADESIFILTILGAEKLSGRGDMIHRNAKRIHVQCACFEPGEVKRICNNIREQEDNSSYFSLPFDLSLYIEPRIANNLNYIDMNHLDPLFADAARLIVKSKIGSESTLRRYFHIGYNRASRLLDQLSEAGIVERTFRGGPRTALISSEEELDKILMKYQISPNPIIYPFKCQTNPDKRSDYIDTPISLCLYRLSLPCSFHIPPSIL